MNNEVKKFIENKGWEFKEVINNQLNVKICPICEDARWKFYINSENGCWDCKLCGTSGNFYQLKARLGDLTEITSTSNIFENKQEISLEVLSEYQKNLNNSPEALKYLTETRGFTLENIEKFKLGLEGDFIVIPHIQDGKFWNAKFRNYKQKGFKRIAGQPSILFNLDNLNYNKPGLVIVESETDCISATQLGVRNVISITTGAQAFPPEWLPYIKQFKEIYICLNSDRPGQIGARKLAEKIGINRCKNVILPVKDVNEYLLTVHNDDEKDDFIKLLKTATKIELDNISSLSDYINDLDAWFDNDGSITGISIPFPKTNSYLNGFKEEDFIILSGTSGAGKCHGKGTKILMYDGSIKNVEDVKVGDQLMGDDSTPRNVLSLVRGKEEMYKIWDKKNINDFYTINKSHILSLKDRSFSKRESINDICFKDYLNYSKFKQKFNYGYRTKINFNYKKCPLEPYYIGVWLSDGNSRDNRIYNQDIEIINYLEDYSKKLNFRFFKKQDDRNGKLKNCYRLAIINSKGKKNLITEECRKLNLFNNKHIPDVYKFNNRKNRLELLAGLLDSDGYYMLEQNGFEITQKNDRLANDIVFLARSLGFNARMVKCTKGCQTGVFGIYNRITIFGNLDEIPTKVKRKQARKRLINKDCLSYRINYEYIGIDDYYGFSIDGNHRYVLGDFSVTHNSTICLNILNDFLKNGKKCMCFFLEGKIMFYILRMMSIETGISINHLRDDPIKWNETKKQFSSYPLYFYSGPQADMDIKKLIELSTATIDSYGIEFVAIDNLQKIVVDNRDVVHNIGQAITSLKNLAVDKKIPVLLIAHVRKPQGKSPRVTMFEAKNSSEIYQQADVYLVIWNNKKDNFQEDNMFLTIEKNRMGEGNIDIQLVFEKEIGRFSERVDIQEIKPESPTKFKNIKKDNDGFKPIVKIKEDDEL